MTHHGRLDAVRFRWLRQRNAGAQNVICRLGRLGFGVVLSWLAVTSSGKVLGECGDWLVHLPVSVEAHGVMSYRTAATADSEVGPAVLNGSMFAPMGELLPPSSDVLARYAAKGPRIPQPYRPCQGPRCRAAAQPVMATAPAAPLGDRDSTLACLLQHLADFIPGPLTRWGIAESGPALAGDILPILRPPRMA